MKRNKTSQKIQGLFYCSLFCLVFYTQAALATTEFGSGVFLVKNSAGETFRSLLLSSKVEISINGLVSYTTVRQRFANTGQDFVEGEYVFPLPETASVDSMIIKIGSRVIKGELQEKQQAKRTYEKAKQEGKRAALMTQDRPNLFRMAVANIPAGEEIEVIFTYVDTVSYQDGKYAINFPMTLTPRFSPIPQEETHDPESNTYTNPLFTEKNPTQDSMNNPLHLSIRLRPGFETEQVQSSTHDIHMFDKGGYYKITFANGFEPMDRDFKLSWTQSNAESKPAFFVESFQGEHYGLLMLTPPAPKHESKPLAKEVIYIIDTSGSMGGQSIRQARESLLKALSFLNEGDSFNIIEFNSRHSRLFSQPQLKTDASIQQAAAFVNRLQAGGGTNMAPALSEAMNYPAFDEDRIRQIIFITDGAVGNESQLFNLVNTQLNDARLFSVAIGSAPNRHLFRQMSKQGKGAFVSIHSVDMIDQTMSDLFQKIDKPALTNIQMLDNSANVYQMTPANIPDVYYGEPVIVAMKLSSPDIDLTLTGTQQESPFNERIIITNADKSPGIAKIWARMQIEELEDKKRLQPQNAQAIKQEIIDLSIKHHIMTQYTSLVAVDQEVVRDPDQVLKKSDVPNLMPNGTKFPKTGLGLLQMYFFSFFCFMLYILLAYKNRENPHA